MADDPPIHRFLEDSADRRPGADVLVHGDLRVTYGELEEGSNRLAAALRRQGVERGQRVALLAENGRDYVTAFFGILKAGAVVVALNHANRPRNHRRLLADSGAVALVTRAAQAGRDLPDLVAGLDDLRCIVTDDRHPSWNLPPRFTLLDGADVARCPAGREWLDVGAGDTAAILYTSGSTGLPRGVTLTHANLAANTRQILAYLPLAPEDSVLVVLPFHYAYGNSLLLTHVCAGGRLVVDNRVAFPPAVVETLASERVTGFAGVPSTYAMLLAKSGFLSADLSHLRYITQAGGSMPPAVTRTIREAMPARVAVYVMYGQTEASARLSYVPPDRLLEKLGSIGIPIPGVELELVSPDGRACGPDEVGEIVARGDNIMKGYWNDPAETARVIDDKGLRTGDLARRDADGFLFIVDRIKNMIKVGANRVSAREIEDVVCEVQGVAEACVVGLPDPLLGEAIEAFVVPVRPDGVDPRQVLSHVRENLAPYKLPRCVHILDELPRTPAGKVDKRALRAAAEAAASAG
ncbi:MAG: class I adenylate-forming enzyme family protein [Candidatus Krumholzibacteriia bacterium]